MTIFGTPDQTAAGWETITTGTNQFAYAVTAFQVAQPCFLTHIGARMRRSGGNNGNVQFAVWQADPSTGLPGDRLGYTAAVTVSATSSSTGQVVEMPIVSSDRDVALGGVTGAAIPLFPGITYFFGGDVQSAGLQIGTIAGATTYYQRGIPGGNPTDPFGSGTPVNDVSPAIPILWFKGEIDAPITVTMTGPATSINTITPTITGTIAQTDTGAPLYDKLRKYEIAVRDAVTTGQMWGAVFNATSAETAANSFSAVYAGTPLSPGGQYEVQARAAGELGVFGAWSAWRAFAVGAVGAVDVTIPTPSGKQPDGVIDTIVGKWTHPAGTAMAKVNARFLSNGEPARSSVTLHPTGITKAASNNQTFTISAAEHGMTPVTDPLPPGNYTYQLQGIDASGGITPWSAEASFSVNFPPNQPSNTRPSSGDTVTTPPLLRWDGSDPDPDDIFGGNVVSYVKILNVATNIETTYGPINDVDPATGSGYLQLVAGLHLSGDGFYQWQVRLNDGLAYGPWSAPSLFNLIDAPDLIINAPTEGATVTSSSPSIVFTIASSSIASYYVEFSRPGEVNPFRVSSVFTVDPPATSQTYQPIPGWLDNGLYYDVEVVATTPVNVVSRSGKRRFRVQYTNAPGLTQVEAAMQRNVRDWEDSSVALRWGMTSLLGNEFAGYVVWRREASQPASEAVPIKLLSTAGSTGWVDHHPPPNTQLIYSVSQLQRVLGDIRSSTPVEKEISTTLVVPVLVSWEDPVSRRAPIAWLSSGLSFGFDRDDATLETWGSEGAPLYVRNPSNFGAESFPVSFTIRTDQYGTLHQHLTAWRAIVTSGDVFSFRTEIGRSWVKVNARGNWAQRSGVGTYKISLSLQEVFHPEIVSIDI
jgi:hypothetical protein